MVEKRGRPEKENSKKESFKLRLTHEDRRKLAYLSYKLDKTQADILREGLEMIDQIHRYKD